MDEKSRKVLWQYTLDAASILQHSLDLIESGEESFYRVAAAQLRILMCDTTFRHNRLEEIAVIPILLPQFKLPPLDALETTDRQGWLLLEDWLNQQADPCSDLTVRQMIRRICDVDGGAHVDPKPVNGVPADCYPARWIVKVARVLLPELDKALGIES